MMTDEEFESVWQRAESRRYSDALMREYPAWRQRSQMRRRATLGVVALLVVVGAALPLLNQQSAPGYDEVYCNRTGTSDAQWANLASDLLLMA